MILVSGCATFPVAQFFLGTVKCFSDLILWKVAISDVSETTSSQVGSSVSGVGSTEVYSTPITVVKLDGTNYITWSQPVKLTTMSRGKWGYITEETKAPNSTDPTYAKWEADNAWVISWSILSIEPSINKMCLFLSSAKHIWDYLVWTYSEEGHIGLIYKLRRNSKGGKWGREFYNAMLSLWEGIDLYHTCSIIDPTDVASFRHYLEEHRVFELQAGLNPEYDHV